MTDDDRLRIVVEAAGIGGRAWERPRAGMTSVHLGGDLVVKLFEPRERAAWEAERLLLARAAGRLGVPTPALVAAGEAPEGWAWVVMERLPGEIAREVWGHVPPADRARVAGQIGAAMRALHGLDADGLSRRWALPEAAGPAAVEAAIVRQVGAGLAPSSAAWIRGLAEAWAGEIDAEQVAVHADLHWEQVLLVERGGRWEIGGLIDFADAQRAPRAFDLVSPFFEWLGEEARARAALLDGYGWPDDDRGERFEAVVLLLGALHPWNMLARRSPPDVLPESLIRRLVRAR